MRSACYLAWRYTAAHRGRTLTLTAALGLLLLLPVAVTLVIYTYEARMGARAEATPMLIGAPGNRFDLVLGALFFRDGRTDDVPFALVERLENDPAFDAQAIPLHTRHTADEAPVVGTDVDAYLVFRGLSLATGSKPAILGEAVVGHAAAQRLGLGVGDTLTTDQLNLYDLARAMPVKMRIVGVLAPAGTTDDRAVFVSLRTAWVIAGLGHGHAPEAHASAAAHAAVVTEIEITPDNADSFHFHTEESKLPLSAVLVVPETDKDRTLIGSRYNADARYQALRPAAVMRELMGLVLRIKRLFDANTLLVGVSALALLGLVVALSLKLREAERHTLHKLGCSRWLIVQTQAVELLIVLAGAAVLAGLGSAGVLLIAPRILGV